MDIAILTLVGLFGDGLASFLTGLQDMDVCGRCGADGVRPMPAGPNSAAVSPATVVAAASAPAAGTGRRYDAPLDVQRTLNPCSRAFSRCCTNASDPRNR